MPCIFKYLTISIMWPWQTNMTLCVAKIAFPLENYVVKLIITHVNKFYKICEQTQKYKMSSRCQLLFKNTYSMSQQSKFTLLVLNVKYWCRLLPFCLQEKKSHLPRESRLPRQKRSVSPSVTTRFSWAVAGEEARKGTECASKNTKPPSRGHHFSCPALQPLIDAVAAFLYVLRCISRQKIIKICVGRTHVDTLENF